MNEKHQMTDERLDQLLSSMKETAEADAGIPTPPVINTFRLQMEAERRRTRIQLEIVTIAAFVSVISTTVFTAVFFRFMLPGFIAGSDRRTGEFFLSFKSAVDTAFKQFGGIFIAMAAAVLLGYVFSAVLLVAKRDKFFSDIYD